MSYRGSFPELPVGSISRIRVTVSRAQPRAPSSVKPVFLLTPAFHSPNGAAGQQRPRFQGVIGTTDPTQLVPNAGAFSTFSDASWSLWAADVICLFWVGGLCQCVACVTGPGGPWLSSGATPARLLTLPCAVFQGRDQPRAGHQEQPLLHPAVRPRGGGPQQGRPVCGQHRRPALHRIQRLARARLIRT